MLTKNTMFHWGEVTQHELNLVPVEIPGFSKTDPLSSELEPVPAPAATPEVPVSDVSNWVFGLMFLVSIALAVTNGFLIHKVYFQETKPEVPAAAPAPAPEPVKEPEQSHYDKEPVKIPNLGGLTSWLPKIGEALRESEQEDEILRKTEEIQKSLDELSRKLEKP